MRMIRVSSAKTPALKRAMVCILVVGLASAGAFARRRAAAPLNVVVNHFEGKNSGGALISDSLELDLEIMEILTVKSNRQFRRKIHKVGTAAFDARKLGPILKKLKIDVLIRGEAQDGELVVTAYANDGRARLREKFELPSDVDDASGEIADRLGQSLKKWRALRPLRNRQDPEPEPEPGPMPESEAGDSGGEDEDFDSLFVEFDEDGNQRKPRHKKKPKKHKRRVIDDEDKTQQRRHRPVVEPDDDRDSGSGGRRLALDDDRDDRRSAPRGRDSRRADDRRSRRYRDGSDSERGRDRYRDDGDDRYRSRDDQYREERRAQEREERERLDRDRRAREKRDRYDEALRREREAREAERQEEQDRARRRIDRRSALGGGRSASSRRSGRGRDRGGADADAGQERQHHLFAVAAQFEGATWRYAFSGTQEHPEQSHAEGAVFYPGGGVHADVFPLEYVGGDIELRAGRMSFQFPTGAGFAPEKFAAFQLGASAGVTGRYVFKLGPNQAVAIGARLGYRYFGAQTETQTVDGDTVTFIPGYQLHSLGIGPDLYVPLRLNLFGGPKRLELEAKMEIHPGINRYSESPDNPGASALAIGWHVRAGARLELLNGIFAEASFYSTGVYAKFDGVGDRQTSEKNGANERVLVQGGTAINMSAGAGIGFGFMY